MSVTIKDVARTARVSVATVSRVLNGKGPVLETTRARIQSTVESLGYVPHGAARSLITRRTNTIGVLLPDIYGEFFSELIRGIDAAVRRVGFHLLVSSSHGERGETGAVFRAMRGRVDGLIVLSPDLSVPVLRASIPESIPVVLVNSPSDATSPFDLINIDNYNGAFTMVRHLHSLGHQRIAFVRGPSPNVDAAERLRGYREALRALGIAPFDDVEFPGNFREDGGYGAGQRIANMSSGAPTAIFAANDAMAIGCLAALRDAGRSVPEDFALAGFDDIPIGIFTAPPLTSVHVSIAELGGSAADRVLHGIRLENAHKRMHLTLPTTLVVRESCGSAPTPRENRDPSNGINGRRRDA
ncbi:MAG TPA: LacI family DNA-binding transcriptional regulator [Thermoanaerobaculia bacterium]|jgi:LacI family transcriptional regulator|nr:LacI family DNA-binding transcriptional regulator [Thermoanaerobaculia bacterium]